MSIEKSLASIAVSLEKLANPVQISQVAVGDAPCTGALAGAGPAGAAVAEPAGDAIPLMTAKELRSFAQKLAQNAAEGQRAGLVTFIKTKVSTKKYPKLIEFPPELTDAAAKKLTDYAIKNGISVD